MSKREIRSLLLLLALALGGHLLRAITANPSRPPGELTIFDPADDGDPAARARQVEALMAPLAAGERIDVEQASAAQLRRLPGVGPALAARIVADRQSRGPFGSLSGLARVSGVGPTTLERLAPHLQFSGTAADISTGRRSVGLVNLNRAAIAELVALPGIGPARARAIVAFRDSSGPFRDIGELSRLPGFSARLLAQLAPLVSVR